MSAPSDTVLATARRRFAVTTLDGRVARAAVATIVIGAYMAIGAAFGLGAEAYLLLGIPITVGWQRWLVRRPLRAVWLRDARPMTVTKWSIAAIAALAVAPAVVAVGGVRDGDLANVGWGLAGMVGAVGAVYALRAMDRAAARATVRASVIGSLVMVGLMVGLRVATGGFHGDVVGAITTAAFSFATYLPVVFVMEEVLFRGVVDPYLHGSAPGPDRASSVYGSTLWGLWHLPVASVTLGIFTIPYLIAIHVVLGVLLVAAWRRTGNLAAPGIAHAVIDAVRNAVAVA